MSASRRARSDGGGSGGDASEGRERRGPSACETRPSGVEVVAEGAVGAECAGSGTGTGSGLEGSGTGTG